MTSCVPSCLSTRDLTENGSKDFQHVQLELRTEAACCETGRPEPFSQGPGNNKCVGTPPKCGWWVKITLTHYQNVKLLFALFLSNIPLASPPFLNATQIELGRQNVNENSLPDHRDRAADGRR